MCFLGNNLDTKKGGLFNLNQKIYKKYFGFNDFQLVMVVSEGQEEAVKNVIMELKPITENMSGWKFVFAPEKEIKPYYKQWDADEHFPVETMKKMGELGLLGIFIPEEYGGSGFTYFEYATALMELGKVCGM